MAIVMRAVTCSFCSIVFAAPSYAQTPTVNHGLPRRREKASTQNMSAKDFAAVCLNEQDRDLKFKPLIQKHPNILVELGMGGLSFKEAKKKHPKRMQAAAAAAAAAAATLGFCSFATTSAGSSFS